jgi:DNA (cytosine-5)-methyltransferase 1
MAHADMPEPNSGRASSGKQSICDRDGLPGEIDTAGPVNGFWRDADWLSCTDELWRPVEPGTFPLADGVASRMDKLRAYGNAINAQAAKEFIAAYMSA